MKTLTLYSLKNRFFYIVVFLILFEASFHIIIPQKQILSPPILSDNNVIYLHADKALISKAAEILEFSIFQRSMIHFLSPYDIFLLINISPLNHSKTLFLSIAPGRLGLVIKLIVNRFFKESYPSWRSDIFWDETHHIIMTATLPIEAASATYKHGVGKSTPNMRRQQHNGELALNNHSGNLYLSFLHQQNTEEELSFEEKQKIFDAPHLANLLYRILDLNLVISIKGENIGINIEANCPNEITAKQTEFILMTLRDMVNKATMENKYLLDGGFERRSHSIQGNFLLKSIQAGLLNRKHSV